MEDRSSEEEDEVPYRSDDDEEEMDIGKKNVFAVQHKVKVKVPRKEGTGKFAH